jgi:tRNA A-37 threonylcarbamoyl transferase component Bud32
MAPPSKLIGAVFDDRYKILSKIGEGAMGEVFLAEHLHLGRHEAVKVLHPETAQQSKLASRFRREARAINRLRHPNIIGIHDFGSLSDGRLYLAMEYADGQGVDSILQAGPMPVVRALRVLHQLALAVDHAHAQGVVHRDLKPANMVLVLHRGHPDVLKILDFGMAKIVHGDEPGGDELTMRGEIIGTPAYMAPERFASESADPRSDLYSVGCIAWELLVGQPPFRGPQPFVVHAHLETIPTPPGQVNRGAGISPLVDAIVLMLMAKDPAHRFANGRDLAAALEQAPGYPGRKAAARTARLAVGWSVEVHEESTASTGAPPPTVEEIRRAISMADTAAQDLALVRDEVYRIMLELAEKLTDAGLADGAVALAEGKVRALRDEKQGLDSQRESLDEREARIEQNARERESSLRFAIGELTYELGRTVDGAMKADLRYQIDQLQQRLEQLLAETEKELAGISDEGVALAAAQAHLDDQWKAVHEQLQQALKARLAAVALTGRPEAAPLFQRYQTLEVALGQLNV